MARRRAALTLFAILGGCSQPAMFAVDVDEKIEDGTLVLNGKSAALFHNVDGAYWGKWNGSDASGRIDVRYPDGTLVYCRVGYVTQGMEPQRFTVRHRKCTQADGLLVKA